MDLVVQEGDGPERRVRVDGDTATIGRAPDCDLVVDRPYVSKEHVRVLVGTVIVDLSSSNGTYVDERRVTSGLVLGDRWMTLGRGDVRVRVEVQPDTVVGMTSPTKGDASGRERELEDEVRRLKKQLADARPRHPEVPAVPAVPAVQVVPNERVGELEGEVQRLAIENAKLRAGLVELKARAAIQLPKDASEAQQLLFRTQRENAALKRELLKAREELDGRSDDATDRAEALARVKALLHEDVDGVAVPLDAALDEFLLAESFRFLRRVERIVSRLAGGLIQLFRMDTTMVPGAQGNTRELVGALLAGGDDAEARGRMLAYLDEIGRWFVVAVGAQKAAGVRYAMELKASLSEEALLGDEKLSLLKSKETELWRRAQEKLAALTAEAVEERLQSLARTTALELMDSGVDGAGGARF